MSYADADADAGSSHTTRRLSSKLCRPWIGLSCQPFDAERELEDEDGDGDEDEDEDEDAEDRKKSI